MITVIGQTKGGVGKTMIAVNMAVLQASMGKKVMLVDSDRQFTATKWSHIRTVNAVEPKIELVTQFINATNGNEEYRRAILNLASRYDEVIIDCGGTDSKELRLACLLADVLIAPARPAQADIWGLDELDTLLQPLSVLNEHLKTYVVLNMTDPLNIHGFFEMAITAIDGLSLLQFANAAITLRPTLQRVFDAGRGVFDKDDKEDSLLKPRADFQNLFDQVYTPLNIMDHDLKGAVS